MFWFKKKLVLLYNIIRWCGYFDNISMLDKLDYYMDFDIDNFDLCILWSHFSQLNSIIGPLKDQHMF